jgi:hypothetical protein
LNKEKKHKAINKPKDYRLKHMVLI